MDRTDRVLYHQIHPLKLSTDIVSGLLALILLAGHHLRWGIIVLIVPPVLVSGYLIRFGNLERLRVRPMGEYVRRYMTPTWMFVRLAGMAIACIGAWQRTLLVVVLGLLLIGTAWAQGALRQARAQ
jgi:hypothetical protein